LAVIAAVAVVIIVVVALLWAFGIGGFRATDSSTPATAVHVTTLTLGFAPGSNPCFASAFRTTQSQAVIAGGQLLYNVTLQNGNPSGARDCTVTALTVNT